MANVNSHATRDTPRWRVFRSPPTVLSQPKISSTHFRLRWLMPYLGCRVVRPSMALARVRWATWGVMAWSQRRVPVSVPLAVPVPEEVAS